MVLRIFVSQLRLAKKGSQPLPRKKLKPMKSIISILLLQYLVTCSFILYPFHTSFSQSEIWGISPGGGTSNTGAIYKTDGNGENPSIVYSFENSRGNNPKYTTLCEAPDGKLYGMTYYDGVEGSGTRGVIFQFDPMTHDYWIKYNFISNDWGQWINGSYPAGSLFKASDGNLYGMTSEGGSHYKGVIFKFNTSTSTFSKLFDFDGINNGSYPQGSLVETSNGKLYGMARNGGKNGNGVIFEFDPTTMTFSKKFDFELVNSGSSPHGDLMLSPNGSLFGTTWSGGAFDSGILFEFNPESSVFTNRFDFSSLNTNGYAPKGSLVQEANGLIYGMTFAGGIHDLGVIFEFDPLTSIYTKKFDFDGINTGGHPKGNLLNTSNGILYGMTSEGGQFDKGVLFEYSISTSTLNTLVHFDGENSGAHPNGSLMQATNGNIYGLTTEGGNGGGTLFEYDYNTSLFNKLFSFGDAAFGIHPHGSLIKGLSDKLYGTSNTTFFEYDPQTTIINKLFDFENNIYGVDKMDDMILIHDGLFCFVITYNGPNNNGAMYTLDPLTGIVDSLYGFDLDLDGENPNAIIQGQNGLIYGTTSHGGASEKGVVFSYDLNTSTYVKLIEFDGDSMGEYPYELVQASDGMIYGFAYGGKFGKYGYGVFFKVDPLSATFTRILDFDFINTGWWPPNMIEASNGKIYWVTQGGLYDNYEGLLMEYDPLSSTINKRFNFYYDSTGSNQVSIMQAANGKLYGINTEGGTNWSGVFYEFDPVTLQLIKKMDFNDSITAVGGNSITPMVSYNPVPPTPLHFNLKVFLEGPFDETAMNAFDKSLLPLSQPFNIPPWNYIGNESVVLIPDSVVDWVLVELRDAESLDQARPQSIRDRQAAFLLTNGQIVGMDGVSDLEFNFFVTHNLFVVIRQRNHLDVMSANPLTGGKCFYSYDFSTSATQALGIDAQNELQSGIYGMYGGDANANGTVDTIDIQEVWAEQTGRSGYLPSDINLDSEANNQDKNEEIITNLSEAAQVPKIADCGNILIDQRDGLGYPTIQIGDQCWMAANLNIGVAINESNNQTDNNIIEKYCNLCTPVIGGGGYGSGGLYQWDEMMQYDTTEMAQGICPDGWHIPSDNEWCILEQTIDSTIICQDIGWRGTDGGTKLKMGGDSGFETYLAGFRKTIIPYFEKKDEMAFFWTSSQNDNSTAWHRDLDNSLETIYRGNDFQKSYGFSVRCIKN